MASTVFFSLSLSHTDTQALFNVRDHVEHWQSMLENVSGNPGAMEKSWNLSKKNYFECLYILVSLGNKIIVSQSAETICYFTA